MMSKERYGPIFDLLIAPNNFMFSETFSLRIIEESRILTIYSIKSPNETLELSYVLYRL